MESESSLASCGLFGSDPSTHLPGQTFRISLTNRLTGCRALGSGPKLKALARREVLASALNRAASQRYPLKHSRTCCHGRTAEGLRTRLGFPSVRARTQSGTILSCA